MTKGLSWSGVGLFLTLWLMATSLWAYHEESEPSDGTVKSFKPITPPSPVPDIAFYQEQGMTSFAAFRGKVVLLNIWATWCPPCIRELPGLDRLQAKLAGEDFVVLPISVDDEGLEVARPFFERLKIKHMKLYGDPAQRLNSFFPVDVLPASFILDRQGNSIAFLRSYVDWDDPAAELMFRALLAGSAPAATIDHHEKH